MSASPIPLPEGTVLNRRYELVRLLGQGGFGTVYLARDLERADDVVVKELSPSGAVRNPDGSLSFDSFDDASAQRMRQQFLREARLIGELNVRGVLPVRDSFQENRTSYFVSEHLPGSRTLEDVLRQEGRMDPDGALDVLLALGEVLEGIHAKGLLHRDLKPSNVLSDARGEPYLIDFGLAREWHQDRVATQTVQFTPGYAPPEQLSSRARRGPATDLYALGAMGYEMLAGTPPPPSTERAAGSTLRPLRDVRPDVPEEVAHAIEACLALNIDERPQSIPELRKLLEPPEPRPTPADVLSDLDAKALALKRFRFGRRECPSCHGVLEDVKPLARLVCPVCREARIRARNVSERLCPSCKVGILQPIENAAPLRFCPVCRTGELASAGFKLPWVGRTYRCGQCGETFSASGEGVLRDSVGETRSWPEWLEASGRSKSVWRCDGCAAQFDDLPDGRRLQVVPEPHPRGYDRLYPEEWAMVAAGLDPWAGNAACEGCDAEYFLDSDSLTLLGAKEDPYRFSERYLGRRLFVEDARWVGAGKSSGERGLVCGRCGTEFDGAADDLCLFHSDHRRLASCVGHSYSLANWHRIAQDLPFVGEEDSLDEAIGHALRDAYRSGAVPLDARRPEVLWKGPAERFEGESQAAGRIGAAGFTATEDEIVFGGLLRKARIPVESLSSAQAEDGFLILETAEGDRHLFAVDELELEARLQSGRIAIALNEHDLAARLRTLLDR